MNVAKAGLVALMLLLASAAVASAADICFEVTTSGGWIANSMLNGSALLVGRAFGTLPAAGSCKDFRGFAPGNQALWFTGQACAGSNNVDVSFFAAASRPAWNQFGYLYFPLQRDTLSTLGTLCTADTGAGGVCREVNVEKVACPPPVSVPQGTDPTCPGLC